ncbi:MAG: PAS domain-containing protein [Chloroflexi bacterium]|nr:PAS domain-containing protein [Chloroflexota bacterium]
MQRLRDGQAIGGDVIHYHSLAGAEVDLEIYSAPLRDAQDRLEGAILMAQDITGRKLAQHELEDERNLLRTLIDNLPDFVFVKDLEGRFVLSNQTHWQILGAASEEQVIGRTDFDFVPPALAQSYRADDRSVIESGRPLYHREEQTVDAQGRGYWLLTSKIPLCDSAGHLTGILVIARDVTELKKAGDELRASNQFNQEIIADVSEGITVYDRDLRIVAWNRLMEEITGLPRAVVQGKALTELPVQFRQHGMEELLNRALAGEVIAPVEMRYYQRTTGMSGWFRSTFTPHRNSNGEIVGVIMTYRDITERKQTEEKLRYLSTHDILTSLYNRAFYEDELARLERSGRYPLSIVIVDVDGLKQTNDRLGHAAGDQLLRRTAQVLRSAFRGQDVIARIGGDEFAILLPGADDKAALAAVEHVRTALRNHNEQNGEEALRFSIGVATANRGMPLEELMRVADIRMYEDKRLSRLG